MLEIDVEAQKAKVVHSFQFDGIAEKVVVDEGLYWWM